MLNQMAWRDAAQPAAIDGPVIDLVEAARVLRRRWFLFAGVLTLTICAAVAYLIATPPRYTATAKLLFEVGNTNGLAAPASGSAQVISAYVDSQVVVLKSDAIARSVIERLHLDSEPDFLPKASFLRSLLQSASSITHSIKESFIGGPNQATGKADPLAPLVDFFKSNLTVKRVGLTYVAEISYQSPNRDMAARIANAVADGYISAQRDSQDHAARRVAVWLRDRIKEFRSQARAAERAIANYKQQSAVDNTGTLSESHLSTLAAQRSGALKDLESTAQAYRTLYQSFLQRAARFQSFPSAGAHVFSRATPPTEKSEPKTLLVLATALLLGAVGGATVAFAREHLNATFVSANQIEKELGVGCLGILPVLRHFGFNPASTRQSQMANASTPLDHRGDSDACPRTICRDPRRYTRSVDDPFSLWSEAVRFLAVDIVGLSRPAAVIGIGSSLAGEGTSTVAANIAELLAEAGRRVLLVDCNLRNPELTRRLAPRATAGLSKAVQDSTVCLDGLLWHDPVTGLDFLPSPPPYVRAAHPSIVVSPLQMGKLLASCHDIYDHVILDLPAVLPVADVRSVTHLINAFILVIEWGGTSQSAVRDALNTAPSLTDKLLGTVLNKANPSALKRLRSYDIRRD